MELVNIENDTVTVALNPPDCLRLAQACAAAEQALTQGVVEEAVFDLPRDTFSRRAICELSQLYAALAVAFAAGAVAAEDSYALPGVTVNQSRWAKLRANYPPAPGGAKDRRV